MADLYEKSIRALELPRVLERLAREAVTAEGKERCLALRPSADAGEVERRLKETSAALELLAQKGPPALAGIKPVAQALRRADLGGSLNPRELLDVAAVLRCARSARDYGGRDGGERGVLSPLFSCLRANRFLEERIAAALPGEDEVADAASAELASIRRHMRACASKARDVLNKLLASSQARFLRESLITQRSGRYVVPVKAEHKNDVPGLVHDVSGSGGTFFIEPMGVVKANNELRELQAQEEKEIERILAELSAQCAQFQDDIAEDYELLVRLDCVFARAQLSSRMRCVEPELSERGMLLRRARHPLLDPAKAVPNDLSLGQAFDTLVVTGPNTGGKTVALKTFGLLSLMAQCGLHIPADGGSAVKVFTQVLADIGDEQSIDQSLSTFSAHMVNIVGILERADAGALVLFDELGAGTDPVEGAALAAAVIESVRERGSLVCATTHYAELKVYAMTTAGVRNASCEFDVETLAPTYRLLTGVPGKSNAFAIASRLGLPEGVLQKAAARLDGESARFEDVLSQLEVQRQAMEKEKDEARRLRRELEESVRSARERERRLDEQRDKAVDKARAEARSILDEARRTAGQVFRELDEMRASRERDGWREENERRAALRRSLNEAEGALGAGEDARETPPPGRPIAAGDTVELAGVGVKAQVLAVNRDGTLQLQAGGLKITARAEEARLAQGATGRAEQTRRPARTVRPGPRLEAPGSEIDLRGMTADEAVAAAEAFLDAAMLGRLGQVTLIHGKGTGALRRAVRDYLKRSRYVRSFRPGRYGEGEDGVTVVELR